MGIVDRTCRKFVQLWRSNGDFGYHEATRFGEENIYNPDNLELPSFDDPRLTDYIWEYSAGSVTNVIAFKSEEFESSPEVSLDFYTPFKYRADFHVLMWPEENYIRIPGVTFDFEQLDPSHPEYSHARTEIIDLIGQTDIADSHLESWRETAKAEGFDKIQIQRWSDVRFEWKVRAWGGLTLEHLNANLTDWEWGLGYLLDAEEEVAMILETFDGVQKTDLGFENLRYADSELDAKDTLSSYLTNPTKSLALEAARSLHRFGGPELAAFHFPELELCRHCGEPPHQIAASNCESRLFSFRF